MRGEVGEIALGDGAQALAPCCQSGGVRHDDFMPRRVGALAHRLVLRPEMWVRRVTGEDLITEILTAEPVPRVSQ